MRFVRRPAGRLIFWAALTTLTALLSRWFSDTVAAYPRRREPGPAAACYPPAARAEQRLAGTLPWRVVERYLVERALAPYRIRPSFQRLRILNVDFGPAGVAIALRARAPLDATVVATDSVTGMADLARQRALERNPLRQPRFLRAWSHDLPFRDGSFDLVVVSGALHGWPYPERALGEIRRVLDPAGRYVIADLRRDITLPLWSVVRLVQALVAPRDLRSLGEPGASIRAAYAPLEAEWLAARACLPNLSVTSSPFSLMIEGHGAALPRLNRIPGDDRQ